MAASPAAGSERARTRLALTLAGLALVVAVALTAPALAVRSPTAFPPRLVTGPYFVVTCSATHRNNDDAIVFPRQPGKSHNHTYVGNRSTTAFSTPDTLRASRAAGGCDDDDASSYWFPTLYARGKAVLPLVAVVYYVRETNASRALPSDLRVIAGNAAATRPQSVRVVSWTCGRPSRDTPAFASPPNCRAGRLPHMQVIFPDCWDGRRVDSANHASHMAYSSSGRCPSSHPVAVPAIKMLVTYPAVRDATLSSGKFSAHADFMNGWDDRTLAELVRGLNH